MSVNSRIVSPPDDALREGLEFVAETDLWTPLWVCDGDWLLVFVDSWPLGVWQVFLKDKELPDLDPSLSNYKKTKINIKRVIFTLCFYITWNKQPIIKDSHKLQL